VLSSSAAVFATLEDKDDDSDGGGDCDFEDEEVEDLEHNKFFERLPERGEEGEESVSEDKGESATGDATVRRPLIAEERFFGRHVPRWSSSVRIGDKEGDWAGFLCLPTASGCAALDFGGGKD